ncbi:MAG: tRNA pseudouridine(55) synthase TruB [Candidatus Sungbacteria bacterium]|nr:tRNA pseudouridine(55) synthase TruB [Candidatus Sungbacteria bacterium]
MIEQKKITAGIFAVYKPKGPTSHDIVDEVRHITGESRVGHAGTLDPLASGVLVIGVGREATRKLQKIVGKEKEYIAKIRFGVESVTDDEEGEKTEFAVTEIPKRKHINQVLKKFVGAITQVPPAYSAVKIGGRAAYKRARAGQKTELKPRDVFVKKIVVMRYAWPFLEIRAVTGPGVYIRALARDIGRALEVGGYLAELERVRVGEFRMQNATALDFSAKTRIL